MAAKQQQEAQNPLILRANRLMEAFAKSDDERDFYLDHLEGFILYVDLDKSQAELEAFENELSQNGSRYTMIPKMTFYEAKKLMEGFVNEKVYDIDTKEKLLDVIQSKDARENFLEFLYDHLAELEKWQQFYQERSRIRIIEWLRQHHFNFVFEEDLDLPRNIVEKLKNYLFEAKVGKDIAAARKVLTAKAKTYYSNEALNPRPKRGRPPKQAVKLEIEPQFTGDLYTTVPVAMRPFLFTPDILPGTAITFSSKAQHLEPRKGLLDVNFSAESVEDKLEALRQLSKKWTSDPQRKKGVYNGEKGRRQGDEDSFELDDFDDDEFDEPPVKTMRKKALPIKKKDPKKAAAKPEPAKKARSLKKIVPLKKEKKVVQDAASSKKKVPQKRIMPIQKKTPPAKRKK